MLGKRKALDFSRAFVYYTTRSFTLSSHSSETWPALEVSCPCLKLESRRLNLFAIAATNAGYSLEQATRLWLAGAKYGVARSACPWLLAAVGKTLPGTEGAA